MRPDLGQRLLPEYVKGRIALDVISNCPSQASEFPLAAASDAVSGMICDVSLDEPCLDEPVQLSLHPARCRPCMPTDVCRSGWKADLDDGRDDASRQRRSQHVRLLEEFISHNRRYVKAAPHTDTLYLPGTTELP